MASSMASKELQWGSQHNDQHQESHQKGEQANHSNTELDLDLDLANQIRPRPLGNQKVGVAVSAQINP